MIYFHDARERQAERYSRRWVIGLYFGSVRFFKNLIFIAVCLLILIPTLLAVKLYRQNEALASGETADRASVTARLSVALRRFLRPAALQRHRARGEHDLPDL